MDEKDINITETAEEVLETLLNMMGVMASVELCDEPFDEKDVKATAPISFNIEGDDLGILIGRRGQTLSCLQYIARLIVTCQTGTWVPIIIDVEGYKQRRYEALQSLALRMEEQVKAKGTPFDLEPMSAYERRIVHITLADSPDVTTRSMGEGEYRKVVILPKGQ